MLHPIQTTERAMLEAHYSESKTTHDLAFHPAASINQRLSMVVDSAISGYSIISSVQSGTVDNTMAR
jgi:hypothetical protein